MPSVAQSRQRALEILRVVDTGQSAEAQHDSRISSAYTEVYNDLKEEGLATWAEAGTIPDNLFPHLTLLMAWNAVDDFGISDALYQRISNKVNLPNDTNGGKAKREIRKLVIPKYESLSEPDDF